MADKIVHQMYLEALKDERAILNRAIADGETDLLGLARDMLANIKSTMRQGFSGDMAHYMRGGRDFWRNQVKKLGG